MGKRILVADDDQYTRVTVKTLLEHEGYVPVLCENGIKCLAHIKVEKFDLILLDLRMPGIETKDILAELKKLGIKTPVFFFSASYKKDTVEFSKCSEGINLVGFIEKPFDTKEFLKQIKKVLS